MLNISHATTSVCGSRAFHMSVPKKVEHVAAKAT